MHFDYRNREIYNVFENNFLPGRINKTFFDVLRKIRINLENYFM